MRFPRSQGAPEESKILEKVRPVVIDWECLIDKHCSRVTDLEGKIEGILARISNNNSDFVGLTADSRTMSPNSTNSYHRPGNTTFEIPFDLPPFQFSNVIFDGFQDVISKGYVTSEQAEVSLRIFRSEASNFPFVVIDPTVPLDVLRRKRPFVLLAILTFAAQWSVPLQSKLEAELKESLCRKSIMNGEKTLDLLQGLLVYINW